MSTRLSALALLACAVAVAQPPGRSPSENAPEPRAAGADAVVPEAVALDRKVMAEVKANSKLMANLEHLSDVIGPRVTGSPRLEKANKWAAEKMKEYGLTDVKLEPWEIPVGWERGTATLKIVEPDNGKTLTVASAAWRPGTAGKVTGPVVLLSVRTKEDLAQYKGKLKNAVILRSPPANVGPVGDPSYLGISAKPPAKTDPPKTDPPKMDTPKTDPPKAVELKKEEEELTSAQPPKKEEPKKDPPPAGQPGGGRPGGLDFALRGLIDDFLREEGAAVVLSDSAKPHGLLTMTGNWPATDRGRQPIPSLFITHEHYALLYRLAKAKRDVVPKCEIEITNTFVPGPITVYNTVGEIKGSDKPDEFVVLGAHLDSWDLGTGTTDNGTGSCSVLEVARVLGALAKQGIKPKRTIRFVLFTGEEQGLYGSKEYVKRHKDELAKTSMCLVHDTGTGIVQGISLGGREAVRKVLEAELETLKEVNGWKGLNMRNQGGTDHLSFRGTGVPGLCCDQEVDEYRYTHHTQTDTFDHAKPANLNQGATVMAVTTLRVANMPDLLPRDTERTTPKGKGGPGGADPKKDEPKKDEEKKAIEKTVEPKKVEDKK